MINKPVMIKEFPGYAIDSDKNIWSYKRKTPCKLRETFISNTPMVQFSVSGVSYYRSVHKLYRKYILGLKEEVY